MTETILIISIPLFTFSMVIMLSLKWFLNNLYKNQKLILLREENKHVLNLKLQAYERTVLLIERISPESLIIREQQQGLNCMQFHSGLIQTIRKEYEHNLAIQIYISDESWNLLKQTKEEIIKLINTCASEVQPKNPSIELGQKILERTGGSILFQIQKTKKQIKSDISGFA